MNEDNENFIRSLAPGARNAQEKYGVPASVTIAQAILESGWGKSGLTRTACNLFGIKADASWHGNKVNMPTLEYVHGNPVHVDAFFRKYGSLAESIEDHAKFLKENPRYSRCFQFKDGCVFSTVIAHCGYATDPHYVNLLISLIKQHSLADYDKISI